MKRKDKDLYTCTNTTNEWTQCVCSVCELTQIIEDFKSLNLFLNIWGQQISSVSWREATWEYCNLKDLSSDYYLMWKKIVIFVQCGAWRFKDVQILLMARQRNTHTITYITNNLVALNVIALYSPHQFWQWKSW